MKFLKEIFNLLIFRCENNYIVNCSKEIFISELKTLLKKKKNIEGKITNAEFDILYDSDYKGLWLIEIKGNFVHKNDNLILHTRTIFSPLILFMILILELFFLSAFIFDKLLKIKIIKDCDSAIYIIVIVFFYSVFMVNYLIGLHKSKAYLARLINSLNK
jgi:hypothetical protein